MRCLLICLSKSLEIVGRIDIGLLLEGSDFGPLLCIRNIFATFDCDGKHDESMLFLMRDVMDGNSTPVAILSILGPRPSRPAIRRLSRNMPYLLFL